MMAKHHLLAVLFDAVPADEALVQALASDPECHAELTRLAILLSSLPGDGARAAVARLDILFDAVLRAVADNTNLCWPESAATSA